MKIYKNSLGIVCVEPDEGYLLKKGDIICKKAYLGKNDRAELYEQIVDENYIYEEKEDIVTVKDEDNLSNLKKELIKLSKSKLSDYLENNPLFSKVKYEDGRYYNVTLEKQNLLLANISTYTMSLQAGIQCPLTWNDTGNECELWTFEELLRLSLEIREYVHPLTSMQQHIELKIKSCKTKAELDDVNIEFNEETINEYYPIYLEKLGGLNEK